MRFVPDWKQAWKWFSMQVYAVIFALPIVWMGLPPDVKAMVPDGWEPWIFVVLAIAGGLGRVIDQNLPKTPAP